MHLSHTYVETLVSLPFRPPTAWLNPGLVGREGPTTYPAAHPHDHNNYYIINIIYI